MQRLVEILLDATNIALLLPVSVLFTEVMVAALPAGVPARKQGHRPPLAVLVPAHNESLMIAATLRSITPQLATSDRLLVVADNCTDDTADVAAAWGAEVIMRADTTRRGKGFALDFGVRHLEVDPREVVVVIDADCRVGANAIDEVARVCHETGRPTQALYLMQSESRASLKLQIAEFAWAIKNLVRPTGLYRLGFPCHLMGSGMAFPWSRIRSATLASAHIVEDLKLGIDMALVGAPPLFCPSGLITSEFPQSTDGIAGQRKRWEHGHLSVILSETPRLFWKFLTSGDRRLLALALDLSVPPIALLTLLVTAASIASCLFFLITNASTPIAIISIASALLVLSVTFSWMRYGRNIISFVNLAYALVYASMKIPLYARFLFARQTTWIRSKRGGKNADIDSRPD